MTRQVTDNLYIDLGYFTPEDYYTYEAVASASAEVIASMTADVGVITQGASVQDSQFDLSATISHIEGVDIVLTPFASFDATVNVIREVITTIDSAFDCTAITVAGNVQNASASFSSEFAQTTDIDRLVGASSDQSSSFEFAVDAVANRSAAITLDTIGNLLAQADRSRDYSSDLASEFTVTALSNSTLEFDAFLEYQIPDLFVDAVKTAEGVIDAGALFSPNIVADAFKNHTAILECTATMAVDAVKTTTATATLDSAFAQTTDVTKLVEAASSVSSTVTVSVNESRIRTASATIDSASTLSASGQRISRTVTPNAFVGNAYSTLEITSEQNKFGGFSLKIPATTPVSVNGEQVFWTGSAFKVIKTGTTYTSTDGLTWTTASNNLGLAPSSTNLVFQNSQFLIKSGSTIAYANSTGTSFSTTTLADTGTISYQNRIDYFGGNYYVPYRRLTSPSVNDVVGFYRSASLTSPSWSEINITTINEALGGGLQTGTFASSGSTFAVQIRASDNSNYSIYRSTNGSTWSNAVPPTTAGVELTFANSLWVLWSSTAVWTSSDLINWTSQSITVSGSIQSVTYLNTKWIVQTDYALYSGSALNSLSATIVKNFNENYEFFPAYGASKYIVLSNDEVLYSTDAVTWSADALEGVSGLPGYIQYVGSSDINAFSSIDFWVYNDNTNGNLSYIFNRASGLSFFRILLNSNTLQVIVGDGTNTRSLSTGNILPLGWSHIRFVQDGANASIYSGGTRRATSTTWLSFSTDTFYIGGYQAAKPLYIDEFLISDAILTPTATTTYTVPTAPWTNSDTVDALFHFNTNFDDDAVTTDRFSAAALSTAVTVDATATEVVSLSAALATAVTVTANATITRGVSAGLAAQGFVVTVAGYLQDDVADLTTVFAVSATAKTTRVADTSVNAVSTVTALVGKVQSADSSLSSAAAVTADILRVRSGAATMSALATVAVDTAITKTFDSAVNSNFAINTVATVVAEHSAALASQFDLALNEDYVLNLNADLSTTAAVTALGNYTASAVIVTESIATQMTANVKTGAGAADWFTTSTLTVNTAVTYQTAVASYNVQGIEFRPGFSPFLRGTTTSGTYGAWIMSFYAADPGGTVFDGDAYTFEPSNYSNKSTLSFVSNQIRYDVPYSGYVTWDTTGLDLSGYHHYLVRINTAESTNALKYQLFVDGEQLTVTVYKTDTSEPSPPSYQVTTSPTNFPIELASTINLGINTWDRGGSEGVDFSKFRGGFTQWYFDYTNSYTSATYPTQNSDYRNQFFDGAYMDMGATGTDSGLSNPKHFLELLDYTNSTSIPDQGSVNTAWLWKTMQDNPMIIGSNVIDYTASATDNSDQAILGPVRGKFTLTAIAQIIQVVSANLQSASTLTVTARKTITGEANLDSAVTVTAVAQSTKEFSAAIDSAFGVSVLAGGTIEAAANFSANATLTADVIVETGAFANLNSNFALAVNAGLLAEGTASLLSASTLSVNADRIKDVLMTVDSACAVQANAIKTAVAEGSLANTATLSAIIDRIPAFSINLASEFAVQAQAKKTAGVVSTLQSQFDISTAASKLVGVSANLTAFYTQLTVGRVISLDPYSTYIVPAETRAYRIHRESRLFTVESENRNYKIRKESRLYTIDSETRIYNIKG